MPYLVDINVAQCFNTLIDAHHICYIARTVENFSHFPFAKQPRATSTCCHGSWCSAANVVAVLWNKRLRISMWWFPWLSPTQCSVHCQTVKQTAANTFYYRKYVRFSLKTHSTFCNNIKFINDKIPNVGVFVSFFFWLDFIVIAPTSHEICIVFLHSLHFVEKLRKTYKFIGFIHVDVWHRIYFVIIK